MMASRNLDSASNELIASLNAIMSKYQLTPTITYYILKEAESQLANLRIQEYILTEDLQKKSEEKPKTGEGNVTELKSNTEKPKRQRISMKDLNKNLEAKIKEKIANGELDENGNGVVSLAEVMNCDSKSID